MYVYIEEKKTIKLVQYYNTLTIFSSDFTSYFIKQKRKNRVHNIYMNTIQNIRYVL